MTLAVLRPAIESRCLTLGQYTTFEALRKAGRIGRVWSEGAGFWLAPITAIPGNQYASAQYISFEGFVHLLDELTGQRKPPGREQFAASIANSRERLG